MAQALTVQAHDGVFCITPEKVYSTLQGVLPADDMGQHHFEFIDDMGEVCASKFLLRPAHMLRLVSTVMAHVAIPAPFLKHCNIKYLENRLPDHSAYAFLKYAPTGGYAKNPTIRHMILWAGEEAGLPFPVHPHMLRHTCGFYLANKGIDTRAIQHYLGHRNIQYTVRYTELAPHRFLDFWDD
jgi:Phage integrase family